MVPFLALLSLLALSSTPLLSAPPTEAPAPQPGLALRYDLPLGQTARYRLFLSASGEQTALEETLPLRWEAHFDLVEEVIAKAGDGTLWLRVETLPVKIVDSAGTLAAGLPARWPALQFRCTPRGEITDVSLATGEPDQGARARSLVSLLAQPPLLLFPAEPVAPGGSWEVASGEARQASRLDSLTERDGRPLAHLTTTAASPLSLTEASAALGLTTRLRGDLRQRCDTDLFLDTGLVLRQTGELRLLTKSQVGLQLPEGEKFFPMESDLKVTFDLRLTSLDGVALAGS